MKTNFDLFADTMQGYLREKGHPATLISDIQKTSCNSVTDESLCKSDLKVLDMDCFAKKGYRKIVLPDSKTEDDSINTADAFLVNHRNEWYFVEFKDAKISNNSEKTKILRKAYSNVYAVMDVLYEMKDTPYRYDDFEYNNPMLFLRNHVKYILVFSEKKNPDHVIQMRNHKMKNENYLPEFMKRLQGYIYKEAYAVSETVFMNTFVKDFAY